MRSALAAVLSSAMLAGCTPTSGGSSALVSSSTLKRVVMQIINNSCGDGAKEDSESLTTGSVKGLSKVLDGFGLPYDEHADNYATHPKPITDDSEEANKERGIGYMGLEAHMPQELAAGQSHSPDHPEASSEPGTTFNNLTTEEEKYGIAMRWEYYNQDNSGHALDGYSAFMGVGKATGKKYVAVHNLVTDKWVICCPYDWGPGLDLPTVGGGKYAGGRIGGVTPQAAEDLGINGGDCQESSMCECWWVENSEQVKCGPVSDLSSLAGAGSTGSSSSSSSSSYATTTAAATAIVSSVSSSALSSLSSAAGGSDSAPVSVAPASPNSFVDMTDGTGAYGSLPASKVRYVVVQDTAVGSSSLETSVARISAAGIRPHFVIDREGKTASLVPTASIAHHAGRAVLGADAAFGISPERDSREDNDILADSAMDAWSVGVALVHDTYDDGYPNAQLNALDRLVAYVANLSGGRPEVITLADWKSGRGAADAGIDWDAQPEDAMGELTEDDIRAGEEAEAARLDTEAQSAGVAGSFTGTDAGDGNGAEPAPDTDAYEAQAAAERGGESVSDDFPADEYAQTGNHAGTETVGDALDAAEQGLCSDGESEVAGGESIAAKAVSLAGTATPDGAIEGRWDQVPTDSRLSDYVAAKNSALPGVPGWADCGRCAATAVRASGADKDFPGANDTAYQYEYMTNSPKWQRVGTLSTGDSPDALCEPGDVLVTEGKGHIMVYVGVGAMRQKFPDSDGNFVEASYDDYYPYGSRRDVHMGADRYAIFRCVASDLGGSASSSSSAKADSLIFIQGKTAGATGNVWNGNGGKPVECGWCSISHAIIIASGDYSLTPDSISASIRSRYGDNWSGYQYNVIILGKVADAYDLPHHPLPELTPAALRQELEDGCPVVINSRNAPFCKEDGHARTHHNHTICFYKYENGTYYAKDSAPSDGSARCAYTEQGVANLMGGMGTNLASLVVGTKATTHYNPRTSRTSTRSSSSSSSTSSRSSSSSSSSGSSSAQKPADLIDANCEVGLYTVADMVEFATSIATEPAVQGAATPWTDRPEANPRMRQWWAMEKELYRTVGRRGVGSYGPGACSPWICSAIQKFGFDLDMGTQEMRTYITKDDLGRERVGAVTCSNGDLNVVAAATMWLYMRNRPEIYEQIEVDPSRDLSEQLQPGDILNYATPEGHGHILMYVGEDAVKAANPAASGNCVESAEGRRLWPAFTWHGADEVHRIYTVFRIRAGASADASDEDGDADGESGLQHVNVSITQA